MTITNSDTVSLKRARLPMAGLSPPLPSVKPRLRLLRCRLMSLANNGPNLFHHIHMVSWQISMPRSASKSPTLRKLSGNLAYIITTSWITSGDELKYRNVRAGFAIRGVSSPHPRHPDPTSNSTARPHRNHSVEKFGNCFALADFANHARPLFGPAIRVTNQSFLVGYFCLPYDQQRQ